ncbi:MAG: nitrile hydratase subunit alpha, partial [Polaromonas sp.]
MPDHSGHDHSHDSEHGEFSEMDLRVRALQSVLTQKGYIDPSALAVLVDTY